MQGFNSAFIVSVIALGITALNFILGQKWARSNAKMDRDKNNIDKIAYLEAKISKMEDDYQELYDDWVRATRKLMKDDH